VRERNLSARLRNGTLVEVLPTGSRITLPNGGVVDGAPHDTDEYRATAQRLGYGDDTLALCHDHDPLHAVVCAWLGLPDSFALRCAAGLEKESELSATEECAVLALQKFMRLAGVGLPI
jgi:hypothetical protein